MLTRAEMKQRAKQAMSSASTHPCLTTLVFLLVTVAISFAANLVFGTVQGILVASDVVVLVILGVCIAILQSVVISGISYSLSVGMLFSYLKNARNQVNGVNDLFAYIKQCIKIFGLFFMISLLTFLWSLLFIIPGVIATYRYSMAIFIYIDDPSKGIMQCISESKQMMVGHKWEYFVLQLSFILWYLLGCVTCCIGFIYVIPYMGITSAIYYDNLKFVFYNGNSYQNNMNGQGMGQVPPMYNNMNNQGMGQVPPMNNMNGQGMNQVPPMNNMNGQGMNQVPPTDNNNFQN